MTKEHKLLFYICAIFSALVFLLSAYLNFSYLHPDEYYQIVEFASYKLGLTPAASLAWEYDDHIRPALQPLMAYEAFNVLDWLNVKDHFTQLFLLRLSSVVFGLFAIVVFCRANLRLIGQPYQRLYIISTFLFWVPYLYAVRFSSEAWAADCMLLAISALLYRDDDPVGQPRQWAYFGIGVLLSLAFLFRFQAVFFAAGLFLWLVFIRKTRFGSLLFLIAGALIIFAMGLVTEHWLYGEWVCSQWSYFESNVLKGVAGEFGKKPFYTYLIWFFTFLSPAIGVVALFSMFLLFIRQPKNIYTWLLLPFLLAHSAIGHKEQRFMFPLMSFLPVVAVLAYQYIRENGLLSFIYQKRAMRYIVIGSLLVCNFAFLYFFVIAARSYSNDPKVFGPCIHELAKSEKVNIIFTDTTAHPFILGRSRYKGNIYPAYLSEKNVGDTKLLSLDSIGAAISENGVKLVCATQYDIEKSVPMLGQMTNAKVLASTLPDWLLSPSLASYLGHDIGDELRRNNYLLVRLSQ